MNEKKAKKNQRINISQLVSNHYYPIFSRHVKYFPFDEQTCVLKFGSWTYDGFKVGLGDSHPQQTKTKTSIILSFVNSSHSYRAILYHIL